MENVLFQLREFFVRLYEKGLYLLTSRKFLAAVAVILVMSGVLPEDQESKVIEAVLQVATAFAYILGVAVEDGLRAR